MAEEKLKSPKEKPALDESVESKPMIDVKIYLMGLGHVKSWEMAGMEAFAIHHDLKVGTEEQFKELFLKY